MKIPINEFEQHVDKDIFRRGLQYFKKGYVTLVEELSGGEYEAVVEGSETYTVNLTIKNGVITELSCTCPYDWGPVCKHEVAAMFYLQQEELGLTINSKKNVVSKTGIGKKESCKKKTIAEQVDELLEKLSPDDIKGYIRAYCKKDRSFSDLFIAKYLYLVEDVSQDLYSKQITAIVNSATDRDGFMNYTAARKVGNEVSELANAAQKELEAGNHKVAMYIGCAILEEMTKAIEDGDDSGGDLGSVIEQAQEILVLITEQPIDESLRKEMFDYCVQSFIKGKFKGWDWHYTMLDLAIDIIKDEKEKQLIITIIDSIKPTDDKYDYNFDKAQQMKLELIRKTESEECLQQFLEANLSNSEFRKEVINRAIENKNYNRAIEVAKTGIAEDAKDKPGLANEWHWYLLQIYQKQNDTQKIILQARYLFLNSGQWQTKEMYDICKKEIVATDWKAFFDQLVEDKRTSKRWADFNNIAIMYVWEQQWDKLMSLLQQNPLLENISVYEKYLMPDYTLQLIDLYQSGILKYMRNHISRSYYQIACKHIRSMIKIGGRKEADILIKNLRTLYPQRRALMEELGRI
jgi:pterin-4a-carbinolamine dehydratase